MALSGSIRSRGEPTKVLGSLLVSLAVAAVAFLVALPFMAVERWAGFAAVAVAAFVILSFRPRLGPGDRLQACRAGFAIAVLLLLPARFFVGHMR